MTTDGLKFDGVVMPTPSDVKFENNKIWSDNTGRSADGRLVGDIICIKKKIYITWTHLNGSQVDLINSFISNQSRPFFDVTVLDETFTYNTYNVYAGDVSYETLSWDGGMQFTKNVTVNLIEV